MENLSLFPCCDDCIETLPDSKEKDIDLVHCSRFLRSAARRGHGILHSIFLTCARIVDVTENMLFSSEVIF